MVNFSNEVNLRRAKRIIFREIYVEEENSVFVRSALRTDHGSNTVKIIILINTSTDILDGINDEVFEFLLYPFFSHYAISFLNFIG